IYQKQDPVDIPQSETRVLKDVLALPWGFEIYGLLTRWNPLDLRRPLPRARTGKRVLVVGMGPAGFTLAHHLLNDGHTVTAIDGLKIEPLDAEMSGVGPDGTRKLFAPIRDSTSLHEALDLTGAARRDSVANMQLRLPVVVIGGGLTAIDTATESLAYYPVQVEKFLARYEALTIEKGKEAVEAAWSGEEREIAREFLDHARAIRAERAAAAREGRPARVLELLQSWGGITIAYRRRLIDSP